MNKLQLAFVAIMCAFCFGLNAQLVTTQPAILQEGSQGVVLTYHADSPLGNKGLANLPQSTDVYAHIGVITNKSTDNSDWKYVVTPWPTTGNQQQANTDKNRLTYVGPNTYTLNIGNIREYFGITAANEKVQKIALVFRTADGNKTGKTSTGGDIFVDVLADGFQMEFEASTNDRVFSGPTTVTFTATTTNPANITFDVNGTSFGSAQNVTSFSKSYNFNTKGSYVVTATAQYSGQSYTKSFNFTYPDFSNSEPYPGGVPKMGAVKNADGSVTFCIAAPGKNSVMIVGSWDDYQFLDKNMMHFHDYNGARYFWITVEGLANDVWYPYYYIVDDTYKVGDPYAHLVLDPWNDNTQGLNNSWRDRPRYPSDKVQNVMLAVYRGDMDDYNFTPFTIPDHDNLVIYEVLLRDFTGVDGIAGAAGNLTRAMSRLQYIKDLGFNAVELMPIMEFAGNNSWGYNTNFYMAPDKAYGSPTMYKDFIEECHRLGMAVILDIVFNQSDGLHPWYMMYPKDQNPFYNEVAPHQWSVLNDWNQGYPLVQQQWDDVLRYWLTAYNVDGFRFDLVKGLGDNDSYGSGTDAYNQSRIDRMIHLHQVIKSVKPNGIHINELLATAAEEKVLGNDGQLQWANVNDASCQFTMGWDTGNNNLYRFLSSRDGGRPWGSTVSYAESHDEERMAYKNAMYGNTGIKLPANSDETITQMSLCRLGTLAAQMLMIPGPKMVWQFGELGNGQTTKTSSGGNDTGAKTVCWFYLNDPGRMYLHDTYAAIINLRMSNPDLFSRNATFTASMLSNKFTDCRYIRLNTGNKEAILFVNPAVGGAAKTVTVPASVINSTNNQLIFASPDFTPALTSDGNGNVSVSVPAGSFAIFASNSVSGVEDIETPEISVFPGEGEVIVNGDYSTMQVYDLSGRAVPNTNLTPGLYIVRVDGQSHKVAVR